MNAGHLMGGGAVLAPANYNASLAAASLPAFPLSGAMLSDTLSPLIDAGTGLFPLLGLLAAITRGISKVFELSTGK